MTCVDTITMWELYISHVNMSSELRNMPYLHVKSIHKELYTWHFAWHRLVNSNDEDSVGAGIAFDNALNDLELAVYTLPL